ncbi:HNH endonuclease [Paraburkholderia panacisoli]|uniref:HNH endonuclease n=1 Tax=Paraburkholderia panacisoli TaxID=2603818 RepID=A0A5B0HD75_9BURK|nr:HNH endonuclease signature motif containing protein [Paraburkholderia panacisoli]KAA1013000.1 HNH endonuclease [Paraburkholderia panacisoli]
MKKPWLPADIALLERAYADTNTATLAEQMDRTPTSVYQKALGMGLKKSAAYMAESLAAAGRHAAVAGMASRFRSGQKAWNTGVKGVCGTHENCRRTQFKKGEMSGAAQHNYVPIGSERLSKDGYLERKVTDDPSIAPQRRWVGVHRLVWEAANGPVPRGHVVCFLAGRRSAEAEKITLDALELVSRKELARRNHPVSRSPELAKLVQLKGAITRQLNRIAREAKEGQS